MNKKGESKLTVGIIVMILVTVIVGVVMLSDAIAPQVFTSTNTFSLTDSPVTPAAAANGTITLEGRGNITAITVENGTEDLAGNFSFSSTDSSGALAIIMTTTDLGVDAGHNGTLVNVTYDYEPDGYFDNSADRTIFNLVIIFAALAIMAAALRLDALKEIMGR